MDYAEIEEAATGNPLIKEQLKLTNEVTKYAHGQTAFKKRQRDAQHVLDTVPAKIDMLKAAQKKIKDDISKRVSTKGDAFKAVIDGKTYTERTKAKGYYLVLPRDGLLPLRGLVFGHTWTIIIKNQ